jgi:hypothetical protein
LYEIAKFVKEEIMRYTKTICILLLSVLAMTSCKEFFEMADVDDEVLPTSITISRGNFSIMEGDQFVLHAQSDVDSLLNGYFWQSSDESVVRMVGDTVVAVGPGIATVKVVSARKQLTAIIDVTVVQQWQVSPYDFAREMMVYADVTVKGQKANESILVGAFSNGELRGVGELCQVGSRQYVQIRVYGAGYTEGGSGTEVINFRCYDRTKAEFYDFPTRLNFDGMTHGTLSNLYKLTIN